MKKKKRYQKPVKRYTLIDEMFASPTETLPKFWQTHQLTNMWDGLRDLEIEPNPDTDSWRIVSDCVNLMETLLTMGEVQDPDGLLMDAVTAMAEAGIRHRKGQALRLSGPGMQAVRAILEDYSEVIQVLPARTMIRAHRLTEQRLHDILSGKRKPHDVEIVDF